MPLGDCEEGRVGSIPLRGVVHDERGVPMVMRWAVDLTVGALVVPFGLHAGGAAISSQTVTQPTPPLGASDFPQEPAGQAPADGNGLIPNPQTPTGAPVEPPSS